MAEPCGCPQATAEPTCTITEGAGIDISGTTITAHSALPWVSYLPATTNFTLGNALNESRYLLNGKTIDVKIAFRFGATSTFAAAPWQIGLPVGITPFFGPATIASNHVSGFGSLRDLSAGAPWFTTKPILNGNPNPIQLRFGDDAVGTNTLVQQGTPFTFVAGDELTAYLRFEIV